MKNFSFKLLQQLNQKKADKGFTLIELLVVIIIIGILSAIALPAFLNQANKARQSEAKQALGAINRGQQAYYLEKQLFSNNVFGLGLGLQLDTENYSYGDANSTSITTSDIGYIAGASDATAGSTTTRNGFDGYASYGAAFGISKNQEAVRDYMGVAMLVPGDGTNESTTIAVLCEEETLNVDTFSFTHANLVATTATSDINCRGTGTAPANIVVGVNAQNVGQ